MASYFDLPSQETAGVATIEHVPEETRRQLGCMSLLSPAVSQLLDEMEDEHSDSSSEEGNLSDDEDSTGTKDSKQQADDHEKSRQDKQHHLPQAPAVASSLSPKRSSPSSLNKGTNNLSLPAGRGSSKGSTKQKHPHMARFHSLRSMLFSANVEDKMKTQQEEHEREEAAHKWKKQHEQRQMHRPKTPEKDAQGQDGIGSIIRTRIRRMTSREVPNMESIGEDGTPVIFDERPSTASSDNGFDQHNTSWKHRDADEESIDHSDVEDLVRWVSQRDPPSDGEGRKANTVKAAKDNSGHESLGDSDVADLVWHVSRGSHTKREEETQLGGYSDAPTASDSELAQRSSEEEEDADDLVRWISHRDGAKAGPVRRNPEDVQQHDHLEVPQLGHGFKQHHQLSGDEREEPIDEPERGRARSRSESPRIVEQKTHLRNDDIDELIRWVSRKDSKQRDRKTPESDAKAPMTEREHDLQLGHNAELTASKDEDIPEKPLKEDRTGSLGQEDVDELVRWVSRRSS